MNDLSAGEIFFLIGGIILGCPLLLLSLFGSRSKRHDRPVIRRHVGLEMKAKNGRLVYIRETESDREI